MVFLVFFLRGSQNKCTFGKGSFARTRKNSQVPYSTLFGGSWIVRKLLPNRFIAIFKSLKLVLQVPRTGLKPNLSTSWTHWPTTMSQQNKLAYQTNTLPESHSTNGAFPTSKMLGLEDFYRLFSEWWNLAGENLLETDVSNKKTCQQYHGVWTKIWPPTWDE